MDEIAKKIYEISKDGDHFKRQVIKTEKAKNKGLTRSVKIENFKTNPKLYKQKQNDSK